MCFTDLIRNKCILTGCEQTNTKELENLTIKQVSISLIKIISIQKLLLAPPIFIRWQSSG